MRKLRLYVNILGKFLPGSTTKLFKGIIYLRHEQVKKILYKHLYYYKEIPNAQCFLLNYCYYYLLSKQLHLNALIKSLFGKSTKLH